MTEFVNGTGFKFFAERSSRIKEFRAELENATQVKMILVGGSYLYEEHWNVKNIECAILPDPRSESLVSYAMSVYDGPSGLPGKIEQTTRYLLKKGIEVRWYPHFIGHEITIADSQTNLGWIQLELVLPTGAFDRRPCLVIEKLEFKLPFEMIDNIFDEMFVQSYEPAMKGDELIFPETPFWTSDNKNKVAGRVGKNLSIGHGQSNAWLELKEFINIRLDLQSDEFNRVPVAGVTNTKRLSEMLDASAIAFIVMTAEDEMADQRVQARLNVVHEAGLFQGRLGFEKVIVLLEDGCEEFSNIEGLGQIRFPKGNISASFEEIRRVLERERLIAVK